MRGWFWAPDDSRWAFRATSGFWFSATTIHLPRFGGGTKSVLIVFNTILSLH
jgi:hypothetical protein